MRNMAIYVILVLLCTIVFTGQSADIPQKDEPSLRDLLGVDIPQQPAPEKQKPKFRVEVSVGCDDENTKAFIESHIKRELRSLQDVEIVGIGIGGGYKLSIVAIENESLGRKTGVIAVSHVFIRTFDPSPIQDEIKKWTKDNQVALMITALMWLHENFTHGLQVGMTDDLDRMCKGIVVNFDTEILEPERKKNQ